MAAPELRLNVSLDLGFFRQQLVKLTNIAQSEFAPKLNAKINRQSLDIELNYVSKMFARRDFRLQVNDTSIKAARTNAQKLKNTLDLIAQTQYKINVQGGGKGFAEGSTGAAGLFEYMRTQGLSGGGATGVGRSARLQQALGDLTVKQLQALAKQEGIVGTSRLRKDSLIEKLLNDLSQQAMERILGNAKMMLQNVFPYVATTGVSGRTLAARVTGQMPMGSRLPALPPAGQTAAFSMGTMPSNLRQPSMPSAGMMGPSSQLSGGYFATGKALQSIQQAYNKTKPFFDTKRFPVTGAIAELGSEFGTALKQVLLYGTAYKALAFLTGVPGQAFDAAKGLATYRNQLEAVTKQTNTFDQSFAFVDNLAQRFNVPLESARQGFVKLFASMQPAGFEQGQIENLFTGIAKASAAFGLSADKVDRVNYAFAQMASKGQIMSEELKGQLGDVLPGALGLFAKAAQMSIPEFSKAMEDGAFKGKAMEQVLDNVGILLNTKFGPAAQGAAKTLQGAVNQIQNNLQLMYESMTPIVNAFAATFGPQVNSLIKDVTSVVQVLTGTFVRAGEGVNALTPRAQALYNAFKTLEPSLRQAGAAIADLGGRFATLLPAIIQATAAAITLASSPLGRGALLAAVAIGTLTAALKLLEVTGLKAALKGVYAFIGGLLKIPAATGVARVAVIGLRLAITGLFVGAVLIGLDFLIGKLLGIGDAANNSASDIRSMAAQLDALAGAGDIIGLATKKQEANNQVIIAERLLQTYQKIDKINKQGGYGYGSISAQEKQFLKQYGEKTLLGGIEVQASTGIASAERKLAAALEQRGMVSRSLNAAAAQGLQAKINQEQQLQSQLQKIDLSGGEAKAAKTKEQNLESYESLRDTLAKNFTQAEMDRLQALHDQRMALQNEFFNQQEAHANSFQKESIKFQRELAAIENKRQSALLNANMEVMKARGSVAGGATGTSTTGATGLLQGSTGISSGDHFDVRRQDGSYISPEQARALFDPSVRGRLAMTSAYGRRRVSVPGASTFHRGVDLAGPANTPLNLAAGYTMVGQGEKGGLGYAASIRGPQGEMYDVGHLQRPKVGAGVPRKVPGSEKRDLVAAQQVQIANSRQIIISLHTEELAYEETKTAIANYVAAIFSPEEQALQNSLLAKRGELIRAGMDDDAIELEMRRHEIQEKVNIGLKQAKKDLGEKKISQDTYNKTVAGLNNLLPASNKLLAENNTLIKDNAYQERIKDLKETIRLLLIVNDEERRIQEIIREQKVDRSKAQEIFDLEEVKKNLESVRAAIDDFVVSTSSDYKGFFKAVLFGEDPVEALKEFQKRLADKVLTIFIDFTMAPVENFFKESLRNIFLPKSIPGLDTKKETTKDPVEATNKNTDATIANTTEIKNLTTAIQGMGAGTNATSSIQAPTAGNAFSDGSALPPIAPGFDAGSVFSNPEALTSAFASIQSSISTSMEGITSSFQTGADSLANTLPSWSDALTTKLPSALATSTSNTEGQIPKWQESLGKVTQGIGIAAGAIMGIAAGISQIKEGGTSNVLGGIGSILLSFGGAIGGFAGLFKAANGAVWKGGFTAFANGGMVNGPTLGLVGEGKYNEAIVPLPDGRSIPVQMKGTGSGSLRDAMGQVPGQSSAPILNMSFQSTSINGVEYVSRDQLEQAMAATRRQAASDGAKRGMTMTLDRIQNSSSTRRRIGV